MAEFSFTRLDEEHVRITVQLDSDEVTSDVVNIPLLPDGSEPSATIAMVADKILEAHYDDERAEAIYEEYILQQRGL